MKKSQEVPRGETERKRKDEVVSHGWKRKTGELTEEGGRQ